MKIHLRRYADRLSFQEIKKEFQSCSNHIIVSARGVTTTLITSNCFLFSRRVLFDIEQVRDKTNYGDDIEQSGHQDQFGKSLCCVP